ncbi:MAG: AAA family ATPase [Chlamydiales bacterium]|nr:AAA family ATPase [Chlamydiales bacterium]
MIHEETPFIGRKNELEDLKGLLQLKVASLAVIKGRRRVGKSRLAREFAKNFTYTYTFVGLAPTKGVLDHHQRTYFSSQMDQQGIVQNSGESWADLFLDVATHCLQGRVLVILDEISWMGASDPTFLGQLKTAWDEHFSKNPNLVLLLSGSQSTWIDDNILGDMNFVGRITYPLTLHELSLEDCRNFWGAQKELVSPYEMLKVLAVTGAIPGYLLRINPKQTAEENIQRLCFSRKGSLVREFDGLFSYLIAPRNQLYKKILQLLAEKTATGEQLNEWLEKKKGGDITKYLKDLCENGFVTRQFTWHLKDGSISKLSHYRLSDNYTRFYLKYMEQNKAGILLGQVLNLPASWHGILGYQFENLVLSNSSKIQQLLGIQPSDIICHGPYFQTETSTRKGCQIDYLIQTKNNNLYAVEIKFKDDKIDSSIIAEVQEKIARLDKPKGFSCRAVLIHVNGVAQSVIENDFFSQIIDFGSFVT